MGVRRVVVVHIDRVTLRGVDPHDRQAVVDRFREALAEQLRAPGAAQAVQSMGHRPSLRVRPRRAPAGEAPAGAAAAGGPATGDWSRSAGAALGLELAR